MRGFMVLAKKYGVTIFVSQRPKFANEQNLSAQPWGSKLWANYLLSIITIIYNLFYK